MRPNKGMMTVMIDYEVLVSKEYNNLVDKRMLSKLVNDFLLSIIRSKEATVVSSAAQFEAEEQELNFKRIMLERRKAEAQEAARKEAERLQKEAEQARLDAEAKAKHVMTWEEKEAEMKRIAAELKAKHLAKLEAARLAKIAEEEALQNGQGLGA